jgi:transposase
MIMLPAAVRIYLCTRPTDMRKSFDGLTGLVQECFGLDPLTGHLFLFLNRRRDCIKLLYFDRDGLAIWYKRLEAGSFERPSIAEANGDGVELQAAQLAMILSGIDMSTARRRKRFQPTGEIPKKQGENRLDDLA